MVRVSCYLALCGVSVDFDEISALVGFAPTSVHRAGSQRYPYVLPQSSWSYEVVEKDSIDTRDSPAVTMALLKLREHFSGREHLIREYCAAHDLSPIAVVIVESENFTCPSLSLSAEVVRFLAELGTSIDYDIYFDVELG